MNNYTNITLTALTANVPENKQVAPYLLGLMHAFCMAYLTGHTTSSKKQNDPSSDNVVMAFSMWSRYLCIKDLTAIDISLFESLQFTLCYESNYFQVHIQRKQKLIHVIAA